MERTHLKCYGCGKCCKDLSLLERIKLTLHTKNLVLNKICKFLDKTDNLCKIYKNSSKFCKEYLCDDLKSYEA